MTAPNDVVWVLAGPRATWWHTRSEWHLACHTEQHPVILELLEIPQLMTACVRNGSYDEALDLKAFASKIALLHPNVQASIPADA